MRPRPGPASRPYCACVRNGGRAWAWEGGWEGAGRMPRRRQWRTLVGMIYRNSQLSVTLRLLSGMARPWPEARGSTPASATHLYRLRSVNQSCTTITTWQTVKRKAAICRDCGSRGTRLQGRQCATLRPVSSQASPECGRVGSVRLSPGPGLAGSLRPLTSPASPHRCGEGCTLEAACGHY